MRFEDTRLAVATGASLPMATWSPRGTPLATVLAVHSYGDFRLAFEAVGPWLAARGVALLAFDQRGFGESAESGRWPGWRTLVADFTEVLRHVQPPAEAPLFLLGESLGGSVVLAAMRRAVAARPAGLILVEPAMRNGVRLRYVWDVLFGGLSIVRPELTRDLPNGRHPLLTDAARRRLAEDPRIVRHIQADAYKGLLKLADLASSAARRLTVPTLLLYGRADGIMPARLFEHAERDLAPVATVLRYPHAPHLLLQAEGWELVMDDVLAWMSGRAAPVESSDGILRRRGPAPSPSLKEA